MAYSWDNRVSFVIKYSYDVDNNGYLDERDFACLALRAAIVDGKGEYSHSRLQEYQHIMLSMWEELAELADFNKDGKITIDEFKQAVQQCCVGRKYDEFPQSMRMFIDTNFKMVDLNDDGLIEADEFRFNCVMKFAIDDIEAVDEAFDRLLSDDDRRRGGLTLSRYQELYAQFLGNPDENCSAVYLFGPLEFSLHESEEENILSDAAKRVASSSDTYESSDSNITEDCWNNLEPLECCPTIMILGTFLRYLRLK